MIMNISGACSAELQDIKLELILLKLESLISSECIHEGLRVYKYFTGPYSVAPSPAGPAMAHNGGSHFTDVA